MIAYFDCTSGVAGDMLVASLLDAGASWDEFQVRMRELKLDGYRMSLSRVGRGGLQSQFFHVELTDHSHHHRDLETILAIIRGSPLGERVQSQAGRIFTRLAQAEAEVHGCDVAKVHFHEVGAVDAIVDIVGTCVCLDLLKVETVYFSRVAVGSGQVRGAHGVLPIPAPATAKLLVGHQIGSGDRVGELATPTGAAILVTLGTQRLELPDFSLRAIGYGAGSRDDPHHPNVVRVLLGESDGPGLDTDEVAVISVNLDDITGEHLGWLTQQTLDQGALDVVQIPATMKKGRPAMMMQVLCPPGKIDDLARFLLTRSTSFGLRIHREKRYKLSRDFLVVILPEGKVRVKVGCLEGKAVQISPEFEDCRKIAERTGENFRTIYARAAESARQELEKIKSDAHNA